MRLNPGAQVQLTPAGEGRFRIEGEMGFGTVMALLADSRQAFHGLSEISLDLAGVERINSAGLALLIEWLRWARREGRTLHFERVPDEALAMAAICEVGPLLAPAIRGVEGEARTAPVQPPPSSGRP